MVYENFLRGLKMVIIKLKSLEDTESFAKIIADNFSTRLLITLSGDLAAGKTTFTKYLAKNLGVTATVNSPTFNILKEYDARNTKLYHIDAYRLEGSEEDLGFEDIFYEDVVCVIEWAAFIEDFLPNDRLEISIELVGEERVVTIISTTAKYDNIVEEIVNLWQD